MPIEVTCGGCSRRLRVPDRTAGKKIKCPKCEAVIEVPDPQAEAESAAAAESWYLKTDEGEDFGPIPRPELDQWAAEGRLNADCQVLKEGAEQWQWATDLYPELEEEAAETGPEIEQPAVESAAAGAADEAGVSDKKKIVAALLALICLGGFGAHRFYLGYTTIGIIQIVVTVCTGGIGAWWGIIEGILILVGTIDKDAQGRKLQT